MSSISPSFSWGGGLLAPLVSYATLTLDSTSLTSDGALTVKSASSSITIIGETNQTGAITVASSSETLILNLGTGTGATTINIATGATNAKTVNIATTGSLTHTLTIGTPSSTTLLQGTTVTIASSTDALTLNLGANTGRHTVNIATGQASSTVNIGSSSSTIVVNNFVTEFPASPVDGQEIIYAADSGNGVFWHFKYYASTTKWIFTGGPPLQSVVATSENTTSGSYAALATAGPSVALPFAGDYDVLLGFTGYHNTVTRTAIMSYDIGGTGAVDADGVEVHGQVTNAPANGLGTSVSRFDRKTGLAAVTLTAKYAAKGAATATFAKRYMRVWPVQK